jgi:hypothetical protein
VCSVKVPQIRGIICAMAVRSLPALTPSTTDLHGKTLHAAFIVCIYVTIYLVLDWISFFQVLPGTCFTPWNPPPAASLALLIIKGPRFAPAVFLAGMVSDAVVIGCAVDIQVAIVTNAITAIGYTGVSVALRRFAHAEQGFPQVAAIVYMLLICCAGTFAVAGVVVSALVKMNGILPNLAYPSLWHFFIGDFTGIVGLLPAVLTIRQARERWSDVSPAARTLDIGVFAFGLLFALSTVFGVASSKELQFFYLLLLPVVWIEFVTVSRGVRSRFP